MKQTLGLLIFFVFVGIASTKPCADDDCEVRPASDIISEILDTVNNAKNGKRLPLPRPTKGRGGKGQAVSGSAVALAGSSAYGSETAALAISGETKARGGDGAERGLTVSAPGQLVAGSENKYVVNQDVAKEGNSLALVATKDSANTKTSVLVAGDTNRGADGVVITESKKSSTDKGSLAVAVKQPNSNSNRSDDSS